MKKLSEKQFENAKSFLKTEARSLERVTFEYEFDGGRLDDVLIELAKYQNVDGGFGNATEPDFRCNASSALATTVGLQHLSRLRVGADHPMVQKSIQYLMNTFNREVMGWVIVPPEVDSAPRAIWWNYKEPALDKQKWANPNAEIVGYLNEYQSLVPLDFVDEITDFALECLAYLDNEKHDLMCYIRLAERLPENVTGPFWQTINPAITRCVTLTPADWANYTLQPIEVIHNQPQDLLERNLDYLIETQSDEGTWDPTWTWHQFEDEWEIAKQEWKGILTLENLRRLRSFGRI